MASFTKPPFGLRLPDDLKTWVAARAAVNGRSMNSEITQIIKAQMSVEEPHIRQVLRKSLKAGA